MVTSKFEKSTSSFKSTNHPRPPLHGRTTMRYKLITACVAIAMMASCSPPKRDYPREVTTSLIFLNNNEAVRSAEICDSSADVIVLCVSLHSCDSYIEITPISGVSFDYVVKPLVRDRKAVRNNALFEGNSSKLSDIISTAKDYCSGAE